MEEKNEQKSGKRPSRSNYNRRRRRSSGQGQRNESGSAPKSLTNGGYTKQNQSPERKENASSSNRSRNSRKNEGTSRNANTSGTRANRGRDRGYNRDHEPKKTSGYQPDHSKEAIREFDLGTCDDAGKTMVFHFDKGTYTISERKTTGVTVDEEGVEQPTYEYIESLSTRDKLAAYKAWNEIKRPKKGGRNKREEKAEETANG